MWYCGCVVVFSVGFDFVCFVGVVLRLVFLIAVLVCIQLFWVTLGGYCLLLGLIA